MNGRRIYRCAHAGCRRLCVGWVVQSAPAAGGHTMQSLSTRLDPAAASLTPAELFFAAGVLVERGHRMDATIATMVWARTFHSEVLQVAEARGFTERKQLREAFRVGRPTPRGQRRTQDAMSYITPAELGMLIERARRQYLLMTRPSALVNLPPCPVFALRRVKAVEEAGR